MQNKNSFTGRSDTKAFTLIELLVVVLIIGILAAIALPQYQKVVEKSKASQAFVVLKALIQAQENYRLANGVSANSFDELGVEIPWTGEEKWTDVSSIRDTRSNEDWSMQIWNSSGGNGGSALYAGRISGPYKGVGFIYAFERDPDSLWEKDKIMCAERYTSGVEFAKPQGSYCQKFFNATYVYSNGARFYSLP